MTPRPQTNENKHREQVINHQLRQIVNRQKRLAQRHKDGYHNGNPQLNCPKCEGIVVPARNLKIFTTV